MRAFVMKSLGAVGYADKPIPEAGPNDAIIKTTRALICTSDAHTVHGAIGPRENLTLGHEAVGVVHAVGSEVKLFRPGDRVVVGAITPDWGSAASQAGHSSQSGQPLGGWKFSNSKDGVLRSISTSTRRTPIWRTFPMPFPMMWPSIVATCSPRGSWALKTPISRLVGQ